MRFPLRKTVLGTTEDSMSFQRISLRREVEIPVGAHVGAFGVTRKHHIHEGVDLYCMPGDFVFAMEPGIVTKVEAFTGEHAGSPWWENTWAVHVGGPSGVIVYGEITPSALAWPGFEIEEGHLIGFVKPVLKEDKGRPTSMLHLELHQPYTRETVAWDLGAPRPETLLDPTPLLLQTKEFPRGR